jgi:hypothetical protein
MILESIESNCRCSHERRFIKTGIIIESLWHELHKYNTLLDNTLVNKEGMFPLMMGASLGK